MNTITELMPSAAPATSRASPVDVPASVTSPAPNPWLSVLATISDMLGPGVRPRRMQVAMKARMSSGDMMQQGMLPPPPA